MIPQLHAFAVSHREAARHGESPRLGGKGLE
jgi:hypothetical protein